MKKLLSLSVFLTFIAIVLTCCKKEDDPVDDLPDDQVNSYSPNGNDIVSNQFKIGPYGRATSFWGIIPLANGDFFFMGIYNSMYTVGRLSSNGDKIWIEEPPCRPSAIMELDGNLLLAGDKSGGFQTYEDAYLYLFDGNDGQFLSELIWTDFSEGEIFGLDGSWLYGYEFYFSSNKPVMLGYEYSKGELSKTETLIFENNENQFFEASFDNYILGGISHASTSNFDTEEVMVYKLNANNEIEWSVNLKNPIENLDYNGNGIFVHNNKIYISGDAEVIEEDVPIDDGYWKDAWFACISTDGTVEYEKTYDLSIYTDYFRNLSYDGTYLYACGRHSQHYKTPSYTMFGYGLIAKIDPSDGELMEYKTIGERTYGSGFNRIFYENGSFKCAGFTDFDTYNPGSGNNFRGWYVNADHF